MILFVNDNKGFMFLGGLIELISRAYQALRTLIPDRKNQVLGLMLPSGAVYCRVCIDRLHIPFNDGKYITYRHSLVNKYFKCQDCGYKLTDTVLNVRYYNPGNAKNKQYK